MCTAERAGLESEPQLTCEMDRLSSSSSMPLWWLPFMLIEGDAMLSLMLSSTADASRLTRRPCVITCSRRSKMHSAASAPTFPLPASNKKDAGCETLLLGTPLTTEHCHLQATGRYTRRQGLQKGESGASTLLSQEYVPLLWGQAEGAPANLPTIPLGAGSLLLSGDSSLCLRGCSRTGFTKDSHRRCSSSCVRNVSPAHRQQLC